MADTGCKVDVGGAVLAPSGGKSILNLGGGSDGNKGRGCSLLDVLSRGLTFNVHASFPKTESHDTFEDDAFRIGGQLLDGVASIEELHALPPVDLKHLNENIVWFVGDREDGREEFMWITEAGGSRRLPGVTTSREVENDKISLNIGEYLTPGEIGIVERKPSIGKDQI